MVIGNGLLASNFIKSNLNYDDAIIFCSGVSNSKETNDDNFNREKELVLKTITQNRNLKFIYFSSILAGVSKNKYYNHKVEIENIIKKESSNYIIFRVPQIIGKDGNKNNLFNFLKESILNDEEITIFENVKRALLDVDDLIDIVNYCKDKINSEIEFWENSKRKVRAVKERLESMEGVEGILENSSHKNIKRIVSLFAGCGGLDLGFIQAGYEVIWANDFFKEAVETYKHNIGDHIIYGDITKIPSSEIPNDFDILLGGFPCQGFSIAGKRIVDDERNLLYKAFVDFVKFFKPKAFPIISGFNSVGYWYWITFIINSDKFNVGVGYNILVTSVNIVFSNLNI